MLIKRQASYAYAGQLYETEIAALEAAIRDIGRKILKDYAAHPGQGVLDHREQLEDLLGRYNALVPPATSTEVASENMSREPKVCQARQASDQMTCARCSLTWDVNDPSPPLCPLMKD